MTKAEKLDFAWRIKKTQNLIKAETGVIFTAQEIAQINNYPTEALSFCI